MSNPVMNEVPFGLDQEWKPDQYWSIGNGGMHGTVPNFLGPIKKGETVLIIFQDKDLAQRCREQSKNIDNSHPLWEGDLEYWMDEARRYSKDYVLLVLAIEDDFKTSHYDYWTVQK